eukprot:TRINITY_DN79_c0_g1_i2.p1 TRINITY_DN79_c0_g1~~TRINITY_DN79_c0_g1_i2.p1  ORF type:complete len:363 (-),score=64.21 TRINITY_DN79_c0_g1_i2:56-1144(-)
MQTHNDNINTNTACHIKVAFNNEFRRFTLRTIQFSQLEANLRSLFSLGDTPFQVQFQDDEDDWILLSSDQELQHAVELTGNLLRLKIVHPPVSSENDLVFGAGDLKRLRLVRRPGPKNPTEPARPVTVPENGEAGDLDLGRRGPARLKLIRRPGPKNPTEPARPVTVPENGEAGDLDLGRRGPARLKLIRRPGPKNPTEPARPVRPVTVRENEEHINRAGNLKTRLRLVHPVIKERTESTASSGEEERVIGRAGPRLRLVKLPVVKNPQEPARCAAPSKNEEQGSRACPRLRLVKMPVVENTQEPTPSENEEQGSRACARLRLVKAPVVGNLQEPQCVLRRERRGCGRGKLTVCEVVQVVSL